jgi:hypothetical protein
VSIPYQIADDVTFSFLLCQGQENRQPIIQGNEAEENTVDVLLRADPLNGADPADPSTWIYVGGSNSQTFPLRDNESVNVKVTRRNQIFFRGPNGFKLHLVSATVRPAPRE